MSYSVNLAPGTYYAGLNRPFFVSQSAVESRLADVGFRSVQWHKRKEGAPPVDPKLDKAYDDGWDEWISADYTGAAGVVSAPARPSWIVKGPPAPATSAAHAPSTPKAAPSSSSAAAKTAKPSSGLSFGAKVAITGLSSIVLGLAARARRR